MPEWANLVWSKRRGQRNTELAGGGIYACFWGGVLVYIGSFVGPETNPFGGHVAARINKHVLGFTLRAKKLFFSGRELRSIIAELDHQIARDLEAARKFCDRLERGNIMATFNKARFAKMHWEELRKAEPKDLLAAFSFAYRRIEPPPGPPPDKSTVQSLWLKPIEKRLIQRFQPICNTEFRTDVDGCHFGIDEVAAAFEIEFALLLPHVLSVAASPIEQSVAVAGGEPNEVEPVPVAVIEQSVPVADEPNENDEHDDVDGTIPTDPRWSVFYIASGQMRVRAVPTSTGRKKGRTLLCRISASRVVCLADWARLAKVGVEAQPVEYGPLKAAVAVDFNEDSADCSALLRKILEACLDAVGG